MTPAASALTASVCCAGVGSDTCSISSAKWIPANELQFADNSWGYGQDPTTLEEFYTRLEGQVDVLLGFEHIAGFCYTQLTDVEQEQNGIYNYDRTAKFDMERIARIFCKARE